VRHASLIRGDAHEVPGAIEQPNRVDGVRKPADVRHSADVAGVLDHRAVAIEKDGR
jgi:hypothetical protein